MRTEPSASERADDWLKETRLNSRQFEFSQEITRQRRMLSRRLEETIPEVGPEGYLSRSSITPTITAERTASEVMIYSLNSEVICLGTGKIRFVSALGLQSGEPLNYLAKQLGLPPQDLTMLEVGCHRDPQTEAPLRQLSSDPRKNIDPRTLYICGRNGDCGKIAILPDCIQHGRERIAYRGYDPDGLALHHGVISEMEPLDYEIINGVQRIFNGALNEYESRHLNGNR